MNRSLALLIGLALTSTCGSAKAGNLVDLGVTDLDTGAHLKVYRGEGKFYVAGTPGHRYALSLNNRTGARVLTVVSIDGVNAVTGQTAAPLQSGYVLGAYEQAEIRGWRKSMSESAEFIFTSVPRSYAARTGRPQNVGVIGVAVFREAAPRYEAPPTIEYDQRDDVAAAPPPSAQPNEGYAGRKAEAPYAADAKSAASAAGGAKDSGELAQRSNAPAGAAKAFAPEPRVRQELGTGHGERRYDPIGSTEFKRAGDTPDEVVTLYYDDWSGLVARGVVAPRWQRRDPDPFPLTFVPDPRG